MRFGVMDHVDLSGRPLQEHYEARLKLIEAYDSAGFYAYHMAEHHFTPLASAPTPGIFLSAVAQRTRKLRFGPLVYLLPFYHPLRLIEEICQLDQMSGGRLQLGVGKGVSPIEAELYGLDPTKLKSMYDEALEVIRRGLSSPVLDFEGEHYRFAAVPMTLAPIQKPHPPLWYGINSPDSTVWAAANEVNIVILAPAAHARRVIDRYREEWAKLGREAADQPLMGLSRHIVVADTDARAMEIARPAFARWRASLRHLWLEHGLTDTPGVSLPETFDDYQAAGAGFAGSPDAVRDYVARQLEGSGASYFVTALSFGDMAFPEAMRSVELYSREVMPAFT